MIKTFIGGIQLPVNPLEDLTFSSTINTKEYDIISFGEIVKMGNRKSIELTIKSLFTDRDYSFLSVDKPLLAISYVNNIYELFNKKAPVRLIITGEKTDINLLCVITGFQHVQKFGEEGEYYYTLVLKEYLEPKMKKILFKNTADNRDNNSTQVKTIAPSRIEQEATATTYTVRSGDSLWAISKFFYGNGTNYLTILNANANIRNGMILPNMVLNIPAVATDKYVVPISTQSTNQRTIPANAPTHRYFNPGIENSGQTSVHTSSSGQIHGGGGRSF